jgi:alkylhydroperoxidase family enzyme
VATHRGVDESKIEALWDFETSGLFSAAEKAALRVARGAGLTPNAVTDEDMEDLRSHFTDDQVVEIVAVIANFGFLNRWNDTMATELERSPLAWAREHLAGRGWQVGKHRPTGELESIEV